MLTLECIKTVVQLENKRKESWILSALESDSEVDRHKAFYNKLSDPQSVQKGHCCPATGLTGIG